MLDDSSSQPGSQAGSQTGASVAEPLVRFTNVQKSYDGEILVVKDLNLDVEQGEFLTMLGPSGSGKTTCLMMLAGFDFSHGVYLASAAAVAGGLGSLLGGFVLYGTPLWDSQPRGVKTLDQA